MCNRYYMCGYIVPMHLICNHQSRIRKIDWHNWDPVRLNECVMDNTYISALSCSVLLLLLFRHSPFAWVARIRFTPTLLFPSIL